MRYIYYGFAICLLTAGIYFRIYRYSSMPFHNDEAFAANRMSDFGELIDRLKHEKDATGARSIGYLFIGHVLSEIYNTDYILRLSSLVPGILSLFLIFLVARELTQNKLLHLFALFTAVLQPDLIQYSKVLKAYSLEVFVHLLIVYLLLRFIKYATDRYMFWLLLSSLLAVFITLNIVFILPAVFAVLFMQKITEKKLKSALAIFISAAAISAVILYLYIKIHSVITANDEFMNEWRDYFFQGSGFSQHLYWLGRRLTDMLHYSIFSREGYPLMPASNLVLLGLFYLSGIAGCFLRKKYGHLLILLLPVILAAGFNPARKWPIGYSRINVFMFAYFLSGLILGADFLLKKKGFKLLTYAAVLFFSFAVFPRQPKALNELFAGYDEQNITGCMDYLLSDREMSRLPGRTTLCINGFSYTPLQYYRNHHAKLKIKYGRFLDKYFDVVSFRDPTGDMRNSDLPVDDSLAPRNDFTKDMDKISREHYEVLFIYYHREEINRKLFEEYLPAYFAVLRKKNILKDADLYYCKSLNYGRAGKGKRTYKKPL